MILLSTRHGTARDVPVDAEHAHPTGSSTEVQVVLEPSGAGTRLTLTHLGIAAGSPGETGWSMALDKLQHAVAP